MEKYRSFNNKNICLFCGEIIEPSYEDYEKYYQCNCVDAKKVEEIEDKIRSLERCYPKPRFKVVKKDILEIIEEFNRV